MRYSNDTITFKNTVEGIINVLEEENCPSDSCLKTWIPVNAHDKAHAIEKATHLAKHT